MRYPNSHYLFVWQCVVGWHAVPLWVAVEHTVHCSVLCRWIDNALSRCVKSASCKIRTQFCSLTASRGALLTVVPNIHCPWREHPSGVSISLQCEQRLICVNCQFRTVAAPAVCLHHNHPPGSNLSGHRHWLKSKYQAWAPTVRCACPIIL